MMRFTTMVTTAVLGAVILSCEQTNEVDLIPLDDSPVFVSLPTASHARTINTGYAIHSAEYLTSGESGKVGRTVFFSNVGNKQLGADFVPGLDLDGTTDVSYYLEEGRPAATLDMATSNNAITRAMNTWDGVTCSALGLYRAPQSKQTAGFVSAAYGFGGSFGYFGDVVHAGWLPGAFFDLLAKDGSTFILAATFTIIFTDDNGNPVDVDNNGKADVAWREIYYNDAVAWADGAHFDVETIALHEAGHGLSQAHFGKAFRDAGKGSLHFSPRAVMNAGYTGIQTVIMATDNGGHCSNWASWPQN